MSSKMKLMVQEDDLSDIVFTLHGDPTLPYIDLFVQDPKTQNYILKKFRVIDLSENAADKSAQIRLIKEKVQGFEDVFIPQDSIDMVMKAMWGYQREEAGSYDETIQEHRAALGMAKYIGDKYFSLEQIVGMVGVLYSRERKLYIEQQRLSLVKN